MYAPRRTIMLLLALMVCCAAAIAPAAAQQREAQQLQDQGAAARRQAAALGKNIKAWDDLLDKSRARAASAPSAETRAAYQAVVQKQAVAVQKMQAQVAVLIKTAERDEAEAAQIRGGKLPEAALQAPTAGGAPSPLPATVVNYLTLLKADRAISIRYLQGVQTAMAAFGPRLVALHAEADTMANPPPKPGAAGQNWHPETQDRIFAGALSEVKRCQNINDVSLQSLDRYFVFRFSHLQSEREQLTAIDNAERDIDYCMQSVTANLWALNKYQANVTLENLNARIALHRAAVQAQQQISSRMNKYYDEYSDAQLGQIKDGNHTDANEMNLLRILHTKQNPVCEKADQTDGAYAVEVANRVEIVADALRDAHQQVFGAYRKLTADLFRLTPYAKSQLKSEADSWLQQNATAIESYGQDRIAGGVMLGASVAVDRANGDKFNSACWHWQDFMPRDLATRAPNVREEILDASDMKFKVAAGPAAAVTHTEPGGTWPSEGP